jgi:hypothetical protein
MIRTPRRRTKGGRRAWLKVLVSCALAAVNLGWSDATVRWVAWSAVEFFPTDFQSHVRRHHARYDAGIRRGLSAPPSWRAGAPGNLEQALESHVVHCAQALRQPIPLEDLVEEIGVLAVRILDASDPLAVEHGDPLEPRYAGAYVAYVDTIRDRMRLVYYGQNERLIYHHDVTGAVATAMSRSAELYPRVGEEFFRTGSLRDWRTFDDRSVTFGVAAISLSWALTDLANFTSYVWHYGGGQIPTPRPTPIGHVGPTVTLPLGGGFPERDTPARGAPAMPPTRIQLPPP